MRRQNMRFSERLEMLRKNNEIQTQSQHIMEKEPIKEKPIEKMEKPELPKSTYVKKEGSEKIKKFINFKI